MNGSFIHFFILFFYSIINLIVRISWLYCPNYKFVSITAVYVSQNTPPPLYHPPTPPLPPSPPCHPPLMTFIGIAALPVAKFRKNSLFRNFFKILWRAILSSNESLGRQTRVQEKFKSLERDSVTRFQTSVLPKNTHSEPVRNRQFCEPFDFSRRYSISKVKTHVSMTTQT